ncbi:MAG: GH3 auxin-responsive promoter family protein, partial [Bacteroidales bacterium]|nr:GH3 auxin-responsive promoter family protein [Bacteroidales bacterium]
MSLINRIFTVYNGPLLREIKKSYVSPFDYQIDWFNRLTYAGAQTAFGAEHNFSTFCVPGASIGSALSKKGFSHRLKAFQNCVPIRDYNAFVPYIDRIRRGEDFVLWNQRVEWFAKSSGTSAERSKYIPITPDSLKINHYGGFRRMLAWYVAQNPSSKIFKGNALTLGGSIQPDEMGSGGTMYGDLSAILLKNSPAIVEMLRTPVQEVALMADFNKKVLQICKESRDMNVTNFSGVPSWNLIMLQKILEYNGVKTVREIWPNIELFMHGGIGFEPYRSMYEAIIPGDGMNYLENYNASEGYFAFQDDLSVKSMLLTVNNGVFYEFIPMNIFEDVMSGRVKEIPTLADVETGVNYAIVITTCGGLWRYMIGDCVQFDSLYPHRIRVTGRTQLFINAFGEELMISNAENALAATCEECKCSVTDFTVAPVFMVLGSKGYHKWAIEFSNPPEDMEFFASLLDRNLAHVNSDYAAKRVGNATMERLRIETLAHGTFYKWMSARSKVGGQNKVPRLHSNQKYI